MKPSRHSAAARAPVAPANCPIVAPMNWQVADDFLWVDVVGSHFGALSSWVAEELLSAKVENPPAHEHQVDVGPLHGWHLQVDAGQG